MVRLLGVVLPDDKRIDYALTILYGIGWSNANKILLSANIDSSKRVKTLSEDELKKLVQVIDKVYKIEGELREDITDDIKRLRDINCFRGIRHMRGLPVRGQRTKSNGRTKRGKRKTVGALKKEVWAKLEQNKTQVATK
ncbi:MAG: 30S ribosomal protein S13 [Candidatus Roizmanbacteria bacterium]